MIKKSFKYALCAVALTTFVACNKKVEEPLPAGQVKASLGFSIEDIKLDTESRIASYDLVGDKKVLSLNLLHLKNISDEDAQKHNIPNEVRGKVPIHLFFMNKALGTRSLSHQIVWADITGEKKLFLPFQDYPNVRRYYTNGTKNDWYVKAFIGGRQKVSNRKQMIDFCIDYLYDVTDETTSYITYNQFKYNPATKKTSSILPDPFTRQQLPMPMETAWTHVKFYFQGGENANDPYGGKSEDYPDTPAELTFKPIGALVRLQLTNNTDRTHKVRAFDFSPYLPDGYAKSRNNYAEPGNEFKPVYINNITRILDLNITEAGIADPLAGATTKYNYNGSVHYHLNTRNTSTTKKESDIRYGTIEPEKSRYFLFWVMRNGDTGDTEHRVRPFVHFHQAHGGVQDPVEANNMTERLEWTGGDTPAPDNRVLWITGQDRIMSIPGNKYKSGHTYFISGRITK